MKKVIYNKLIRDKIPAKMDARGAAYKVTKLANTAFKKALLAKVAEEAQEVASAVSKLELVAEIADVLDVIDEIRRVYQISDADIIAAQTVAAEKKGGFSKRLFLEWTVADEYQTKGKPSAKKPASQH